MCTYVFPTRKSGASCPAHGSNGSTRKSGGSCPAHGSNGSTWGEAVNHICVCMYMLCRAPMMFTCIKVLRPHNSCKGRVKHVKYEPLEQTTCCWVGQSKQNWVGNMLKHGEGLSLTLGRGWDGRIREMLQGIAFQVCVHDIGYVCESSYVLGVRLICLFSPQVKNKPWQPWVYSWIQHRREHYGCTVDKLKSTYLFLWL